MRVGVLTGLAAEARLLQGGRFRGAGLAVARTGADPATARREAERLVASGAVALISFGVAGGLHPGLQAGDLVLADRVILPGGRAIATHAAWRGLAQERLAQPGTRAVIVGAVAGSHRLLVTPDEKRLLGERSGGIAGDMESGAVAEVAAEAGVPFLVVRAVSDGATRVLPQVARVPLRPDGGLSVGRIAHALCTRPGEWPAVARLAVETRAAMAALRAAVHAGVLLPPGAGFAAEAEPGIALQAA